jgi:5-(carboxyamino)imidazole ribonucleotide synthase
VHNSAHYTQDACPRSQFENHWRGILGLRPEGLRPRGLFGMLNLLGPEDIELELGSRSAGQQLPFEAFPAAAEPLKLHWYWKSQARPRRKLGHVNSLTDPASGPGAMLEALRLYDQAWKLALAKRAPQARKEHP